MYQEIIDCCLYSELKRITKPSRLDYNTFSCLSPATVPCVPQNANGHLDCLSNNAWVSWDPAAGATSYFSMAQAANGDSFNCTASSAPCEIVNLKCGTLYTFAVTASNDYCSSNRSKTFDLVTGTQCYRAFSVG